uniref:Tripartite motif-containing protein 45-like n=1 Tax=Saccoglossus kowalevskii TaxID=10224 RepID=A0ABM0GPC8_SACKO
MNGYASSTDFGLKIVCVVCDKKLREPRVLSCLHTFCIDCIRSFEPYAVNSPDDGADSRSSLSSGGSSGTNRGKSVVILCPECDTEVSLPSDGIEALPSNFIAQKFLLLASLNQESAKLQCDLCADSSSAGSRCEECSIYMCGFCVQAHKRQRKTSSHTVISLEEARKKGLNNVHRPIFCRTHSNEEVQMFCENCDETVCRDCCLVEHRNHRCEFIDNVLSSKKQIIHNLLSQTKPHIDVLEVAIEGVESMQVAVTEKCDEITNDISMFIDSYIKALEKHKNNLLSKVDEMESEKHKILNLQSIQLKQMLDDFKSSCSFVTDVLEEGSGAEILSVRKLLLNRLRELNSYKYKCEPKTNSFIKFLSSENAGSVDGYKMIGHVTSTEDQQFKCIVKGE